MNFDAETFSKVAGGIQSIVTSVGLLIAGAWVVFTFWGLRTTTKARHEIAVLEQTATEQPVLQIVLTGTTINSSNGRAISLSIRMENGGKRTVEFSTPVITARLAPVPSEGEKASVVSLRATAQILDAKGKSQPMPLRLLRPGQSRTIAVLLPVPAEGNYLIQVESTYGGMTLKNGKFEPSGDEPIAAYEQAIVSVAPKKVVASE